MAYLTSRFNFVLLLLMLKGNLLAAGDENWDQLVGNPGVGVGGVDVAEHKGHLYAFGSFNSAGGIAATNIALWTAGAWTAVGGGIVGDRSGWNHVAAVASDGQNLYAGGLFSMAGAVSVKNIARWDGTNWSPLGDGINGSVQAIVVSGTNLFVGGSFTEAGGVTANNVARWDGTSWSALGEGIQPVNVNGEQVGVIFSLAMNGRDLIAGGRFRRAGGVAATNIARWTGSEWQALGNGLRRFDPPDSPENGTVYALAVDEGVLYAGGHFRLAGETKATNIAQWSSEIGWRPVGSGVDDLSGIQGLAVHGNILYAGGTFRNIGGVQATRIAQWDGNTWGPLGTGIVGYGGVTSLAPAGDRLFVGGYFPTAGGKPSTNVAIWHIPHALSIQSQPGQVRLSWPATGSNLVLEAKSALNDANWSEVARNLAVNSDQCVITEPEDDQRFYRLRRR